MQTVPVVLNSGPSVKAKSQNMCHHSAIKLKNLKKKRASKRCPETEKKVLAYVPQLMTAVPCLPSTPVPLMFCKGRTKVDIH